jgi:hypothetical protein
MLPWNLTKSLTYNNAELLFSQWISEEFTPAISDMKEDLLVMDIASFHKMDDILNSKNSELQWR